MMLMQGSGKNGYQMYSGNKPKEYIKEWVPLVGLFVKGVLNFITYEPHPVNDDTDVPWTDEDVLSITSSEIGTNPASAFLALPNSEAFCLVNLQRVNGSPSYFWVQWLPKESNVENGRTMKEALVSTRNPAAWRQDIGRRKSVLSCLIIRTESAILISLARTMKNILKPLLWNSENRCF